MSTENEQFTHHNGGELPKSDENETNRGQASPDRRLRRILSETEPEEASLPDYPLTPQTDNWETRNLEAGTGSEANPLERLSPYLPPQINDEGQQAGNNAQPQASRPVDGEALDLGADYWGEGGDLEATPPNIHDEDTIPPQAAVPVQPVALPKPVSQTDADATRVTPSAFQSGQIPPHQLPASYSAIPHRKGVPPAAQKPAIRPDVPPSRQDARPAAVVPPQPAKKPVPQKASTQRNDAGQPKPPKKRKSLGCFWQFVLIGIFILAGIALAVASFGVYRYYQVASSLPDVATLRERASQFETTRILDRNGNLLYEVLDPNAGRRTYIPLERISPNLIAATIATEDKDFYDNPGFDLYGITRALWQNYTSGEVVSGASTITQQLARLVLMTQEERYEVSTDRKAREIILAAEITRRYTKDEILELYLNEIYFSNMAYGVEAAAETYFNTSAANLTMGQAAFLAGLPQGPGVYDIFTNRDETLERTKQVLVLMYTLSNERNCIDVESLDKQVCLDATDATLAYEEIVAYPFEQSPTTMKYPHWVFYIRSLLEAQYDPQTIYRSGFTIYTTLDPDLQEYAQQIVSNQVSQLTENNATDAALVAIKPGTGEILAMVGSADFYNEAISGQVNMAVSPRQPGSAIKPLTYAAAFEKGWTPATLIWDVPTDFPPSGDPNDTRPPYQPVNYNGRFNGPVTVRTALANSLNIPAVKTLQFVGIYDNPNTEAEDGFINFAKRLGITTLTRDDYGLSLTLGGGDVSLLELTGAFSVFANAGQKVTPVAIARIMDSHGNEVYAYTPQPGEQVIRSEHAYLISDILSDNNARAMMFGTNSVLNLPFRVAAKTGTTNDFRDNWTIGYTPDLAVGVWVGNADYTPMQNTTGLTGAAPIWSEVMQYGITRLTGGSVTPFYRPNTIVDRVICSVSGAEPSERCPSQRSESFAVDQLPLPKEEDLWQNVMVDTWTGLLASPYCSDFTDDKLAINVTDPYAIRWLKQNDQGISWAEENGFEQPFFFKPARECKEGDARPRIEFAGLSNGQTIDVSPLDIYALISANQDYRGFRLEYGAGEDPEDWKLLEDGNEQYVQPELVYSWDISTVKAHTITLRIYVESSLQTYAEKRITLKLKLPTPTPTETLLPTETPTPTLTPTETIQPAETVTPTQTQIPEEEATATP